MFALPDGTYVYVVDIKIPELFPHRYRFLVSSNVIKIITVGQTLNRPFSDIRLFVAMKSYFSGRKS